MKEEHLVLELNALVAQCRKLLVLENVLMTFSYKLLQGESKSCM